MKQLTAILLAMLMIATPLGVISEIASSADVGQHAPFAGGTFGGGDGSAGNPYIIEDVLDLQAMQSGLGANYSLGNDIDASATVGWNSGEGFVPIGNSTAPFTGSLNGNLYIISSLFISRDGNYQGLFGQISSTVKVQNIFMENVYINALQFRGAIAGDNNGGTIRNCTSSGTIAYASSNAGGIVGRMIGGLLDNCSSTCAVSSTTGNNIGGLVGQADSGSTISNSWSKGDVQGQNVIGGFIGVQTGDGTIITGCFATGDVTANDVGGGFAGRINNGADTFDSYATGDVSVASNNGAGGFVGNHLWTGDGTSIIQRCYATGDVSALGSVGGFVGTNTNGPVMTYDCYALGNVSGNWQVGGFVGSEWDGPIERCYSTGNVTGTSDVGGFAGWAGFNFACAFLNNRWDNETSGTTIAVGHPEEAGDDAGITGNSTAQLLQQSTYTGFNFNTVWWSVNSSTRPFLRMEWGQEIRNSHQLQMMQMDPAENYTLANDIDMSDIVGSSQMWGTTLTQGGGFVPAGNATKRFTGSLEGNGYEISGLYINRSSQANQSLLGWVYEPAAIMNVTLNNVNVSGGQNTGALAGYLYSGTLRGCSGAGLIKGSNLFTGGLIGYNVFGSLDQCAFDGTVYSTANYAGGLIGRSTGEVTDSGSSGSVHGAAWVGGLIGDMLNSGYVENCFSYSEVSGGTNVGGLIGWSERPITRCHAYGDVSGVTSTGGLVGTSGSASPISNSSASGHVTGTNIPTGGLVGWNGADILFSNSSGDVDGTGSVGGLVGLHASGNIVRCNARGGVTGSSTRVGGLVGNFDSGLISDCFAIGDVTGQGTVGGLVGTFDGGAITESYAAGDVTSFPGYAGGLVGWAHLGGMINNSNSFGYVRGVSPYIGGFVGYNEVPIEFSNSFGPVNSTSSCVGGFAGFNGARLESCTAYGTVTGRTYTGGLVGYNGDSIDAKVLNCTAYGEVTNPSITDSHVGGLIGRNNAGLISNCQAHGNATSFGDYTGGLIGHNTGAVYQSCSHGNADSGMLNCAGGFIGWNLGSIQQCFSTGSATTTGNYAGGFIGQNYGGILNCYAWGSASGHWFVGGFIGDNHQIIQNAYSVGNASATGGNCGGFIGFNETGIPVVGSYWDLENSGTVPSQGGAPRNTAEMMSQATFAGWDFSTLWGIYEANTYPFLRAFGMPPEPEADLEITIDDLADPVQLGSVIGYRVMVQNHGPGNALDVFINITLPPGTSFLNSSAPMDDHVTYLTADIGILMSGETGGTFLNLSVDSFTASTVTCTATISSTTDDPGVYPNVSVEATGVNRGPSAANNAYQTTEDYILTIIAPGVLGNDLDPDLDALTVISHEPSDYGAAVTILADGSMTYNPTVSAALQALHGGETVYDTFNYVISDGRGGTASAAITIRVDGQEGYPIAHNDTFVIQEDSGANVLDVLANDVGDEEGDAITILEASLSSWWHGTLAISGGGTTLTFTPTENFYGTVNFSYAIHISTAPGGWGYGTLTVLNVNDPPAITSADVVETLTGSPYLVNYTATDIDGDALTWSRTTNATWLSINASGALSGTPENSDAGIYSVSVRVSDGHGGYDWSNFTLTVLLDTDGDGIPDTTDTDDDGDGVPDADDLDPLDPDIGAEMPPADTDGDGVPDSEDAFPTDPAASVDTDGDGMPDAWNPGYTAEDSTTGLVLDDDPNTPFSDGPGSNIWLYIIIILVIACIAGAAWWFWPKKPSPEKFDPLPAESDEEPPNFKTDPSDANKVEPKENIAEDGAVTYVESQTPYDRLG